MKTIRLTPQIKLTTIRQIALALATAPMPTSALEAASGGGYSLIAHRNKSVGGCAFKLRKGKESWSLVGYSSTDIRRSGETLLTEVIKIAEDYITRFKPGIAPMVEIPPPTPITAIDRIQGVIINLDKALKRKISSTPLRSDLEAARRSAEYALELLNKKAA